MRYLLLPDWELFPFVVTRLQWMEAEPNFLWKHVLWRIEIHTALEAETRH